MVSLGLGSRRRWCWCRGLSFGGSALTGGLGLLGLAASLGPVGLDPGLDALLGLEVLELLLAFSGGFLDLLLALQLLLGLLCFFGRFLSDFLVTVR